MTEKRGELSGRVNAAELTSQKTCALIITVSKIPLRLSFYIPLCDIATSELAFAQNTGFLIFIEGPFSLGFCEMFEITLSSSIGVDLDLELSLVSFLLFQRSFYGFLPFGLCDCI